MADVRHRLERKLVITESRNSRIRTKKLNYEHVQPQADGTEHRRAVVYQQKQLDDANDSSGRQSEADQNTSGLIREAEALLRDGVRLRENNPKQQQRSRRSRSASEQSRDASGTQSSRRVDRENLESVKQMLTGLTARLDQIEEGRRGTVATSSGAAVAATNMRRLHTQLPSSDQDVALLRAQVQMLNDQLATEKQATADLEEIRDTMNRLVARLDEAEFPWLSDATMEALTTSTLAGAIERTAKVLIQELLLASSHVADASADVTGLRKAVERAEKREQELIERYDELMQNTASAQAASAHRLKHDSLREELARMKAVNAELMNQVSASDHLLQHRMDELIRGYKEREQCYEVQAKEVNTLKTTLNQYQSTIECIQRENDVVKKLLETKEQVLRDLEARLGEGKATLISENQQLKTQTDALKRQLSTERNHFEKQLLKINATLTEAQGRLAVMEADHRQFMHCSALARSSHSDSRLSTSTRADVRPLGTDQRWDLQKVESVREKSRHLHSILKASSTSQMQKTPDHNADDTYGDVFSATPSPLEPQVLCFNGNASSIEASRSSEVILNRKARNRSASPGVAPTSPFQSLTTLSYRAVVASAPSRFAQGATASLPVIDGTQEPDRPLNQGQHHSSKLYYTSELLDALKLAAKDLKVMHEVFTNVCLLSCGQFPEVAEYEALMQKLTANTMMLQKKVQQMHADSVKHDESDMATNWIQTESTQVRMTEDATPHDAFLGTSTPQSHSKASWETTQSRQTSSTEALATADSAAASRYDSMSPVIARSSSSGKLNICVMSE